MWVIWCDGVAEPERFDAKEDAVQRLLQEAKEYSFNPEYDALMTTMDRATIIKCSGMRYEFYRLVPEEVV